MRYINIALSLILGFAMVSCNGKEENIDDNSKNRNIVIKNYPEPRGDDDYVDINLNDRTRAIADKSGDFAFRLFKQSMKSTEASSNESISPVSVMTLLSMLANADDGISRDNILEVLGYKPSVVNMDDLNEYARVMIAELPKVDGRTICRFTNSFWHDESMTVVNGFKDIVTNEYDSEDIPINPAGIDGMNAVNKWVDRYTNGIIPEFIKNPLDGSFAILNATYFKGLWKNKFSPEKTVMGLFCNLEGGTSNVPLMHNTQYFGYANKWNAEYVLMPFLNRNFQLIAILPEEGVDFNEFIEGVSYEKLLEACTEMVSRNMNLTFPKFKSESTGNLLETLKSMGMETAVKNGFHSAIEIEGDPTPLMLASILHSVSISIDEEGAEAAAATAATFFGAPCIETPIDVTFNRPFIYLIREKSTGAILFMGKVTKL